MKKIYATILLFSLLYSCGSDNDNSSEMEDMEEIVEEQEEEKEEEEKESETGDINTPTSAFDDFNSDAVTVAFDGDDITITTNALPNHTSPYWQSNNDLYIEPIIASEQSMSPGFIQESSYTLTVPILPTLAASTTETGLGAIGISVSGVPIYNQSEGPTDVTDATASGFDWTGGHSGPTGYHYHVEGTEVGETTTLPIDNEKLLGIMSDGFLIYGRKCNSTGTYPTDGDDSNGHYATSQHSDEEFYHYHIVNEIYLNKYYLLFGVNLQGTPNTIM